MTFNLENFHQITPGYINRWLRHTWVMMSRHAIANMMAITLISCLFFLVPAWNGLSTWVSYIAFAVLIAIARFIDTGFSITGSIRVLIAPALKIAAFDIALGMVFSFVFSGVQINQAVGNLSNLFVYNDVWQGLHGFSLIALNILTADEYPKAFMQNLPVAVLIYMSAARGRMPSLSLDFLMSFSMVLASVLRNIAPSLLMLIFAEFLIHSQDVIGTIILDAPSVPTAVACAIFIGTISWVGTIWLYFYLKEMVDGEPGMSTGPGEGGYSLGSAYTAG